MSDTSSTTTTNEVLESNAMAQKHDDRIVTKTPSTDSAVSDDFKAFCSRVRALEEENAKLYDLNQHLTTKLAQQNGAEKPEDAKRRRREAEWRQPLLPNVKIEPNTDEACFLMREVLEEDSSLVKVSTVGEGNVNIEIKHNGHMNIADMINTFVKKNKSPISMGDKIVVLYGPNRGAHMSVVACDHTNGVNVLKMEYKQVVKDKDFPYRTGQQITEILASDCGVRNAA